MTRKPTKPQQHRPTVLTTRDTAAEWTTKLNPGLFPSSETPRQPVTPKTFEEIFGYSS
jgi:hypothetical protein